MDKNQILLEEIGRRLEELEKEITSHYKKIDTLETIYDELSKIVIFANNIEEDDNDTLIRGKRKKCINVEDGKCIEKLEFDEVFEEDNEELNGLKKDYSEVCGSFEEFKKQFDSMINRGETVCECCGEKVVKESDGYYYCGVCDYEHYIGEEDDDDCTPDLFRDELNPCDSCDDWDCDNCEFNDDDKYRGFEFKADDDKFEYYKDGYINGFCKKCNCCMQLKTDEDGDEYYQCPTCGKIWYL